MKVLSSEEFEDVCAGDVEDVPGLLNATLLAIFKVFLWVLGETLGDLRNC